MFQAIGSLDRFDAATQAGLGWAKRYGIE